MTKLSKIDQQDAGTLICTYMICSRCGVVDRERSRIKVDSPCPTCRQPAGVARLYYPISIHILVDLIQQSYHSVARTGPISGPQTSTAGPILFFCTLREVLISHFLVEHMSAQGIKASLIRKILDDNKLAHQKFTSLVKAVTDLHWTDCVHSASRYDNTDYASVSALMKEAAELRNDFLDFPLDRSQAAGSK